MTVLFVTLIISIICAFLCVFIFTDEYTIIRALKGFSIIICMILIIIIFISLCLFIKN